jgi:outer membrane protein assembly factor BamB
MTNGEGDLPPSGEPVRRAVNDLVFVGFNSRIAALDRYTGELVWKWKAPSGMGFTAVLLDGDRLMASVQGYTYCLDPMNGRALWMNDLKGFGTGVPSLASVRGSSGPYPLLAEAETEETQGEAGTAGAGATAV